MPTTESGWPVLPPSSPLIRTVVIPDDPHHPTRVPLRWGTPALILGHLALRFDTTIEDVNDGPVVDDWGYAYRAVRGYSAAWSDHAGGEAVDLDAVRHPLGTLTFTSAQVAQIHKILEQYKGVVYWGGDYHNRKDQMHFGLAKTLHDGAEAMARSLLDTKRGQLMCAANPGLRAYVLS